MFRLKAFRSIGITTAIKELINGGPPTGILTRFLDIFAEKAEDTEKSVKEVLQELGWAS